MRAEHGPTARIVAVEQVTTGGIGGFFASRRFSVTVEMPDATPPTMPGVAAHDLPDSRRVGLAALLDEADAADGATRRDLPHLPPGFADDVMPPAVSTTSREFAEILTELHAVTAALAGAPAAVPTTEPGPGTVPGAVPAVPAAVPGVPTTGYGVPTTEYGVPVAGPGVTGSGAWVPSRPAPAAPARLQAGVGDLVVVAGAPGDALSVARAMSFTMQADVVVAGCAVATGLARIDDRRGAITARARGVERERIVIAAFGIAADQTIPEQAEALAALCGDQLWLAVDTSRKPEDTARWVSALAAVIRPDAVAALGREMTSSPETVGQLGLPVNWAYDG